MQRTSRRLLTGHAVSTVLQPRLTDLTCSDSIPAVQKATTAPGSTSCGSKDVAASHSQAAVAAAETLRRRTHTLRLRQQRRCGVTPRRLLLRQQRRCLRHTLRLLLRQHRLRRQTRRLLLRQQRRCGVELSTLLLWRQCMALAPAAIASPCLLHRFEGCQKLPPFSGFRLSLVERDAASRSAAT